MNLTEILEEIPKLSFIERQMVIQKAMADEPCFPKDEDEVLEQRMKDFRLNPKSGIPLEKLKSRLFPE
ncbi:MAG: hypothetical protein QM796_13720 [Chthoniobacteraceae bacterium]